jgi:hypothetical protein
LNKDFKAVVRIVERKKSIEIFLMWPVDFSIILNMFWVLVYSFLKLSQHHFSWSVIIDGWSASFMSGQS